MRLELPQDASMSDIYKYVMEYSITHTLVQIPEHELLLFNRKLFNDLDLIFKHEFEIDEARKISHYFQKIRQENRKHGKKELTFDTIDFDRGRHSRFRQDLQRCEKIDFCGSDPTLSGLRHAVGDFGDNFCSSISGYWSSLADEGVSSSTSFETMISKGLLVRNRVTTSSYAVINVDKVSTAYAYGADTTLFFHAPDSVKTQSLSFEFVKERCSYGKTHVIELTLIKLKPTSKLIARARAEFDFDVIKGFKVDTWAKVLSLGINKIFDEEQIMTFSSDQFLVDFECFSYRFKMKEKPVINISIKDAREFLSFDQQMMEYQQKLGMKKELKQIQANTEQVSEATQEMMVDEQLKELQLATVELSNHVIVKSLEAEKKLAVNSWILYATLESGRKTIFTVKVLRNYDRLYTLEITARNKAFSHMDKAFRNTGVKKWEIVLEPSPTNISDLNNVCGPAFEEIVNARVMAKAAEHGIPIKCIEGDGRGQYTDAEGNIVSTPEYVDAVFANEATGDMISVQYKFSDQQWKLEETVQHWRDRWSGEDLSGIDIVVPKGVDNDGNFSEVVQFSDEIVVGAPTPDEVYQWLNSNRERLRRIASESRNVRGHESKIERLENRIERLKKNLEKKERFVSSGQGNPEKLKEEMDRLKERIDNLEENIAKLRTEKERADTEIERVITEDGLNPIPGVDDDVSKNRVAKQAEIEERVAEANKELAVSVGLAIAINAATELMCSLVDEIELWREGKQTLGEAALHIFERTGKASIFGAGIGLGIGVVQYSLTRMAVVESSSLVAALGVYGSKVFGPALIAAGMIYQSHAIVSQYNKEKEFAPSIAKRRMIVDLTRMVGVNVGSVGCFAVATAVIASTPVGLAVGAVCCIAIGVADHLIGKFFNFDLQAYKELRPKVIDKAYALFGLESHCSDKELKKAYRAALLKYHPDKAKNKEEATEITQAIFTAYTLLITVRAE